jgi:cell wall-associated NlpC family hydrolase
VYDAEWLSRRSASRSKRPIGFVARTLLCLLSITTVGASTLLGNSHPVGADNVSSARAEAAAIASTLAAAQNKMSALGQQYDAARAQLGRVDSAIAATKNALAQKQRQVVHDKRLLQRAALEAYMSDGSAATDNPLFSSNGKTQGAANEYSQIASGDLDEAVADLDTAKAKLSAQKAQLTAQEGQAQNAVSSEQAALTANQLVEQQQSAALAQENGEIATLVAQQQQAEATQAAHAAQATIAAAATAQAKLVADQNVAAAAPTTNSVGSSFTGAGTNGGGGGGGGSVSAPPPYTPVPVAPGGAGAVAAAESQLGVPYVWGGETPGVGFDCSGLMQWAWRQAGVNLPRTSGAQFAATTPVSVADLEPGDLLFYGPDGSDHVAMYVGGGTMIEAPETGQVVHLTPLRLGGYGESFAGAGRP